MTVKQFLIRIACILIGFLIGIWRGVLSFSSKIPDPYASEGWSLAYYTLVLLAGIFGACVGYAVCNFFQGEP